MVTSEPVVEVELSKITFVETIIIEVSMTHLLDKRRHQTLMSKPSLGAVDV